MSDKGDDTPAKKEDKPIVKADDATIKIKVRDQVCTAPRLSTARVVGFERLNHHTCLCARVVHPSV